MSLSADTTRGIAIIITIVIERSQYFKAFSFHFIYFLIVDKAPVAPKANYIFIFPIKSKDHHIVIHHPSDLFLVHLDQTKIFTSSQWHFHKYR